MADAPFGSLHHFSPSGKEQRGEEVLRSLAALCLRPLEAVAVQARDAATALAAS